ncbi:MAG: hypothetical protein Q8R15_01610 [Candidatus Micrarchaeota archaeon]|nr:hypothetical protein [Candidatus Micrarchaeota archaeon]
MRIQRALTKPVLTTSDELLLEQARLLNGAIKVVLDRQPHTIEDLVSAVINRVAGHEHFRNVDRAHLPIHITARIKDLERARDIERVRTAAVLTYRLPRGH